VLALVLFSAFTQAWLLYLGLIFLLVVMYAPGGIASLVMMNLRVARSGHLRGLLLPYLGLALTGSVMLAGGTSLVEMVYHLQLNQSEGPVLRYLGLALDVEKTHHWLLAALVLALGGALFEWNRRGFVRRWDRIQAAIEARLHHREMA
jgi:branched-chain amino acid transport system permease protein